jgi:hypothetical protein
MKRFTLVALVAATFTLTVPAVAATQTSDHPASTSQGSRCQTAACHKRVRQKARIALRRSCRSVTCKRRVAVKQARWRKQLVVAPYTGRLEAIARCESGGRWNIATGNGFYGGLQFTLSSWHAVGGWGYPHQNTKLEQMYRAVLLMRMQGWGAWPVCQHR